MNIVNKLRKRIKTIAILNGDLPNELEITQEDFDELQAKQMIFETKEKNQIIYKFEGVKLKVRRS